ncbi:hypothetical protein CUMW_274150 [Citrus unshiu]|uniref:nucleoside-diphosphate kinase n=1 Tax=Citrus unshiu TaxID=55188 RepID=A0A2H5MXI0_CITUN|nr:hypothetical protein CUMW_274150 [Citrus unshiu]
MVRVREAARFVFVKWFRSNDNDSTSGVKRRTGLEHALFSHLCVVLFHSILKQVGFSESQRNGTNFHHDQARWGPKRLVAEIISRFEKKGFSLKGLKLMTVDRPFAQKHYEDLLSKPFFGALIGYITSGPVIAMIWEGAIIVIILNFFNK